MLKLSFIALAAGTSALVPAPSLAPAPATAAPSVVSVSTFAPTAAQTTAAPSVAGVSTFAPTAALALFPTTGPTAAATSAGSGCVADNGCVPGGTSDAYCCTGKCRFVGDSDCEFRCLAADVDDFQASDDIAACLAKPTPRPTTSPKPTPKPVTSAPTLSHCKRGGQCLHHGQVCCSGKCHVTAGCANNVRCNHADDDDNGDIINNSTECTNLMTDEDSDFVNAIWNILLVVLLIGLCCAGCCIWGCCKRAQERRRYRNGQRPSHPINLSFSIYNALPTHPSPPLTVPNQGGAGRHVVRLRPRGQRVRVTTRKEEKKRNTHAHAHKNRLSTMRLRQTSRFIMNTFMQTKRRYRHQPQLYPEQPIIPRGFEPTSDAAAIPVVQARRVGTADE